MSNPYVLRIRWTDPADDSSLFGWQLPSLVLATLFLNFFFWYMPANGFQLSGPPAVYLASLLAVPAMIVVLFFLGPALAAHETRRSLFEVAEASFGTIPAIAFRLGCAVLCVFWIAAMSGTLTFALRFMLRRDPTMVESGLFLGLLLLFLFLTGLQRLRTSAQLAFFTNKLAIALLIAGAIRMRGSLGEAWRDLSLDGPIHSLWLRAAEPLMFIGPLAFLAADFGYRSRTRKDVALIGTVGLAVPMATTLFVVGLLDVATYHSHQNPGGDARIIVALLGPISQRYWPQWMTLVLITLFGVARFAVRMSNAAVSPLVTGRKPRLAAHAAILISAGALSIHEIPQLLSAKWEIAARLAACAAAIISADYLMWRWRTQPIKRVDWLALLSFLAGWMAVPPPSLTGSNYAYDLTMSILRPYTVSFVVCLLARVVVNNLPPRLRFM